MGNFRKYQQPPRNDIIAGQPQNDMYEPMDGMSGDPGMMGPDPMMMGGGLPGIDFYGQPKQQWNEAMMDRLIDTCVPVMKDDKGNIIPRPKLWLFETSVFRHFQLTNLRSRDQTEIERDILDIQMLAHQDGNDTLCDEMQQQVFAKLAMFKSRSDLPVQLRERDAWITNVSQLKTQEIKRPQGGNGSFFSDLIGGKKRGRDY